MYPQLFPMSNQRRQAATSRRKTSEPKSFLIRKCCISRSQCKRPIPGALRKHLLPGSGVEWQKVANNQDASHATVVKHLLCVSNDSMLMQTRQLLLESAGYQVTSACGFVEGASHCRRDAVFDLLIICHSVAPTDKRALIDSFQATHKVPIIAMVYRDEIKADGVILHRSADGPQALLASISSALAAGTMPDA
jgi:CheY-like chemotaxis protein